MNRFAFTIEFDGTPYMGWQRQSHGPSVQQAIEQARPTLQRLQHSEPAAALQLVLPRVRPSMTLPA